MWHVEADQGPPAVRICVQPMPGCVLPGEEPVDARSQPWVRRGAKFAEDLEVLQHIRLIGGRESELEPGRTDVAACSRGIAGDHRIATQEEVVAISNCL